MKAQVPFPMTRDGGIWIGTVDPEHADEVEAWIVERGGEAER